MFNLTVITHVRNLITWKRSQGQGQPEISSETLLKKRTVCMFAESVSSSTPKVTHCTFLLI